MASYIILGILMFGVLIFIHELGHFLAAKKCKVGIYEFSIGMGPKIISKTAKAGVLGLMVRPTFLPLRRMAAMVSSMGESLST